MSMSLLPAPKLCLICLTGLTTGHKERHKRSSHVFLVWTQTHHQLASRPTTQPSAVMPLVLTARKITFSSSVVKTSWGKLTRGLAGSQEIGASDNPCTGVIKVLETLRPLRINCKVLNSQSIATTDPTAVEKNRTILLSLLSKYTFFPFLPCFYLIYV